jgi:DNA-dependent RNA polymerase auxiliary subunit epsilon
MNDITSNPVELQCIKLDLKTRWPGSPRFTHEKLTNAPELEWNYSNNSSRHLNPNTISRFASDDDIVKLSKKQNSPKNYNWNLTADEFWQVRETRVTYDVTPKRRYRRERTYTLLNWYEQDLENEIRNAIAKVEAKYQKKFVKHIDDKIQSADPFYAWVKNGDMKW